MAGITRDTPTRPGGTIVRDASGEPTGVLKDGAMTQVYRVIPPPAEDEIAEAVHAAMRTPRRTELQACRICRPRPYVCACIKRCWRAGNLPSGSPLINRCGTWERLAAVGLHADFGNEKLHIGGLKGFAEDRSGSTTALLFEPYLDAPNTSGLANSQMIPESKMQDKIVGADARDCR